MFDGEGSVIECISGGHVCVQKDRADLYLRSIERDFGFEGRLPWLCGPGGLAV